MSDAHAQEKKDRSLEQALTNKIIDGYFIDSESWLRAILRMCIFSLGHLEGEPIFIVECPNQAVAKRLRKKTYPFRGIVYYLTNNFDACDRSIFCYQNSKDLIWYCFDTRSGSWRSLSSLSEV
ncbi:MAG: hypothetical protein AAF208_06410 [Cyanobacteria bacterium P01_A01_bin.45]